jgi:3-hydroxyacyl-CoA dehydrogenase/enoyl-CoA hydratase/3-hydroxybutyryl-CoA epimerase
MTLASVSVIRREVDADDICHLIFDRPGSSANVFTREALLELERHVAWLGKASSVRGVILRSAKPGVFIAGADLNTLSHATAVAIEEMLDAGQRIFSAFAALPFPKIAAIHGACLGGGYELALCCDFRVATDHPSTRIGLPETQLGLVPAWGGCTRLPRLIGVADSLRAILKGTQFSARSAGRMGLVDEVVPVGGEVTHACRLARDAAGRPLAARRPFRFWHLAKVPFVGWVARKRLRAETRGNYPAAETALELVTFSLFRSVDASLAAERVAFARLVHHAETRNLLRLFFAREKARKTLPREFAAPVHSIGHVAVIGAGVMGSGIACWLAARGKTVDLLDVSESALTKAAAAVAGFFGDAVRRDRMGKSEAQAAHDRITLSPIDGTTAGNSALPRGDPQPAGSATERRFHHADLIIEAAVEDPSVKRRIFADLFPDVRHNAVVATNTSALPIGSLASDPRLIGLHFFNPVAAMPLVEVIRPVHARPEAIATAVRFVQEIGKVPLVVKDSAGFLVNRILLPYLLEAARLAHEGVSVRAIDEAMRDFGMPMGPLRLLDEIGLDVALDAASSMADRFPNRVVIPGFLQRWVEEKRLGKKSGRGFYHHGGAASNRPGHSELPTVGSPSRRPVAPSAPGAARASALAATRSPSEAPALDPDEIAERLSLLLVNEAARCLDEGVVASAQEIDLGLVLGAGFAPFRGGPLRYAEQTGLPLVVGRLRHWQLLAGPLYEPARPLVLLAEMNGSLFSKFEV